MLFFVGSIKIRREREKRNKKRRKRKRKRMKQGAMRQTKGREERRMMFWWRRDEKRKKKNENLLSTFRSFFLSLLVSLSPSVDPSFSLQEEEDARVDTFIQSRYLGVLFIWCFLPEGCASFFFHFYRPHACVHTPQMVSMGGLLFLLLLPRLFVCEVNHIEKKRTFFPRANLFI